MKRLKLLRVIPDLQVGGVQRMLLRTLKKIMPLGVDAEVCCIKAERGQMEEQFEAAGIPVHHIAFGSRMDPIGLWRLRKLAFGGGFQVVHGHMYGANIAVNLALIRASGVAVVNGYHSQRPVSGTHQGLMVRWTKNLPAAWVAVSESVRAPLIELGVPAERIHVIYNGISDPGEVTPIPQREPGTPIELVWAGRFVPQKRHPLMIDVLAACKARGVPARLTLVGDGPRYSKAARRVAELGLSDVVRFAGVQENVWPFLAESDLFITTSEREGFPNALIEACAAGRGFLASDIPPHAELCASSGAGMLFGDDVNEWVKAIEELGRDRERIARMGAESARLGAVYTIDETARRTMELYRKLIGE